MPSGRNTDLTEELIEKIANNIRNGDFFHIACRKCGVPENTAHQWKLRGRGKHPDPSKPETDKHGSNIFEKFVNAIEQAEADAESALLAIIEKSAKSHEKVTRKTISYANGDVQEEETIVVEPNANSAKTLLAWRNPEKYDTKSDFSKALVTLASYGLRVYLDSEGVWQLKDETNEVTARKILKKDKTKFSEEKSD